MKVYIDSDVIISSLISSVGAANLLINKTNINRYISNFSYKELDIVVDRLGLNKKKFEELIKKNFLIIKLYESLQEIKKKYSTYIYDPNDAHIIAGAFKAKTNFIISYNIKHFKIDKIKQDLNIIICKPAVFLQYLRSLKGM
jgi:putative PIN family toxin of toxin-antitoxin system